MRGTKAKAIRRQVFGADYSIARKGYKKTERGFWIVVQPKFWSEYKRLKRENA